MTAKEYFNKYEMDIMKTQSTDDHTYLSKLVGDFTDEAYTECCKNKAETYKETATVLKNLNKKWNELVLLFEKKYKNSPIQKDGVLKYWTSKFPPIFKNYL